MKIEAAVFDLDGTLVDSMSFWQGLADGFLSNFDIKPDDEIKKQLKPLTMSGAAKLICEKCLPDYSYEQVDRMLKDYMREEYINKIEPKHGVKNFLFALKCKGVRICVATATDREFATALLKRLHMLDYFSVILCCSELATTKNESLIYDKSFDILGKSKESTYIFEDSLHCIETAKKAGYKVVGVRDLHTLNVEEKIIKLSDIFIKDYDDFRGMI